MWKRLLQDEKVMSVTGTIFVHGALIILFILIQINFRPVIEEFAELTFSGGWLAPTREMPLPEEEQLPEEVLRRRNERFDTDGIAPPVQERGGPRQEVGFRPEVLVDPDPAQLVQVEVEADSVVDEVTVPAPFDLNRPAPDIDLLRGYGSVDC